MGKIDQRDRLKESPFDYNITKSKKMMIYFENRHIMTLSEKESGKIERKLKGQNEFNIQLILAKVTGNFKHGNER